MLLCMGKFRELLPVLTCKAISLNSRCQIYSSCVRGTILYSSECWALMQEDKKRLERSDNNKYATSKKKQCLITNSPPKSIETEKPGFSVKL